VLGGERESRGDSGDNQIQVGALLSVAVKSVDRGKVAARFRQVRGDQRAVANDGRLKYNQEHGEQPCPRAKHPPCRYEDEHRQQQREQSDERPCFGEDFACVIGIEELSAYGEICRFIRSVCTASWAGVCRGIKQQRNGSDKFCERRMFGIDAVVAAPMPVACVDVDSFVNGLRFVPRGESKLRGKNQQKQSGHRILCFFAGNEGERSGVHLLGVTSTNPLACFPERTFAVIVYHEQSENCNLVGVVIQRAFGAASGSQTGDAAPSAGFPIVCAFFGQDPGWEIKIQKPGQSLNVRLVHVT
jgi:hypothetical protein